MSMTRREMIKLSAAAFAAGAHGYVLKEEGTEKVVEAIQLIQDGGTYLSAQIATKAPNLMSRTGRRSTTQLF